jgi:hypothetical protein
VWLAWAFCDSCLSVVYEFWRSMLTMPFRWAPLLLKGRSLRGGLFWVLFWAVAKEYLARGARTAKPK